MLNKEYNYVIARFWTEDEHRNQKDRLCVYAYGSEVRYGTKKDAYADAKVVSVMTQKEYKPYFIDINERVE